MVPGLPANPSLFPSSNNGLLALVGLGPEQVTCRIRF